MAHTNQPMLEQTYASVKINLTDGSFSGVIDLDCSSNIDIANTVFPDLHSTEPPVEHLERWSFLSKFFLE